MLTNKKQQQPANLLGTDRAVWDNVQCIPNLLYWVYSSALRMRVNHPRATQRILLGSDNRHRKLRRTLVVLIARYQCLLQMNGCNEPRDVSTACICWSHARRQPRDLITWSCLHGSVSSVLLNNKSVHAEYYPELISLATNCPDIKHCSLVLVRSSENDIVKQNAARCFSLDSLALLFIL